LPVKDAWTNASEKELATSLNNAIDRGIPFVEDIIAAEEAILTAQNAYIAAVEDYASKLGDLKNVWKSVFGTEYSDLKYTNLTEEEKKITGFADKVLPAREAELDASSALSAANNELNKKSIELKQAQRDLQNPRNEVFSLWEQTAK
jgi:hypothetical protein